MKLINIYEEGTEKSITTTLNNENNIVTFIYELRPILEGMGIDLKIDNDQLKNFIEAYVKLIEENPEYKNISVEQIASEMREMYNI